MALVAVAAAAFGAGCGGDDRADAEKILNDAFSKRIPSADVRIQATVSLQGEAAGGRPIRIEANGPYIDNPSGLPKVDLTVRVGPPGGPTVESGYLSTGDRAFVKFQDVFYELPRADVERQIQEARKRRRSGGGSLKALGLDPRRWLSRASVEGDEQVGGVETRHVRGKLDVRRLLEDLNRFIARNRNALSSTGGSVPQRLPKQFIDTATEVVRAATFDVYAGKDDGILRRLAGRVELDLSKASGSLASNLGRGTVTFSVQFDNVGGKQRVEAPAQARPISELRRLLRGSANSLLGGATGAVSPQASTDSDIGGGSGGGAAAPPSSEQFKRYGECLDRARPGDIAALQRCSMLLRR